MPDLSKDTGVLMALLKRMEEQRMPRVLAIKERVDRGEKLEDVDISFLKGIFDDANKIKPLMDRHPEYHSLVTSIVNLYSEITSKALENEK
jgi:hypothetical protein